MSSNEKKLYTRVYTSEEKKEKQSSKQEQPLVKKKRDRIHNEIVGEFSNYGMRVHY